MIPLLKKLLKMDGHSDYVQDFPETEKAAFSRKSIRDLFRIDLDQPPLHHFREGLTECDRNGIVIRNYYKDLDYKECGIFDQVYVKMIGDNARNIIFKSSDPAAVGTAQMREIINDLYHIYGYDSNNKGICVQEAATDLPEAGLYVLFGRDWMDYPRYPYPVSLRRYAGEVFISIWGIAHPYMA